MRVTSAAYAGLSWVGAALARFWRAGRQKMTIMFVPHSEKTVFNLQISVFGMVGVIALVGVMLFSFVVFLARDALYAQESVATAERIRQQQLKEDAWRDMAGELVRTVRSWQETLAEALEPVGITFDEKAEGAGGGALAEMYGLEQLGVGDLQDIEEIRRVTAILERSEAPIKEFSRLIANNRVSFREIPNIWPVRGGIGHISMYYGQNENPFTGQWYIHKGIDISTFRSGDPIVATADGKVIYAGYDWGYGNYVVVQHAHGFFTRYGHMQEFIVASGDKIRQGQTIGYIGSTGLSTGPHLHYEVILGTDIIDPLPYVNLRSSAYSGRN
jgi:murein DD-endopeptidase MepM/ murein hydrolase activator NlpD